MRSKLALAILAGCAIAAAQHDHGAMPAEKPVSLYSGLGSWTHPIATTNPQAQKYFDQGLALMSGFNRPEALRSFRKALELDPTAAMAQWGIAMSLGPYVNMDMDPDVHIKESCEAVAAGLKTPGLRATDRAWLDAAGARCPEYADPSKYIAAMRQLAARFPDDPDAQTWFAESLLLPVRWRWYGKDGKPAEGVAEAERVLEAVLHRFPYHPCANHLYIHAVESSPTPERAVPSAQRLMGIMPAGGHMVHMPGHIWLVLGEYQTAVDVNERAAEVDRKFFAETGSQSTYYMYYLHNLNFILYARSMQGRRADTDAAVAQFEEAAKPIAQSMPDMADAFGTIAALTRLRMHEWDALLAAERPAGPVGQLIWRFTRAMAFAGKEQSSQARAEQAEFEKIRTTLDRNMPWSTNKLGDVADLAAAVLAARFAAPPESVALWRKAVDIQDNLAYDEPPAWYYPIRESLGASLLMGGDAAGAEEVFREGVRRSPKNGRMLFGLLESLRAQSKPDAAAWVEREYRTAWEGADTKLQIADLR